MPADGITPRDESNEVYRNTMKQVSNIKDVKFICNNYSDLEISNAVIYYDPPYSNKTKYSTNDFNTDEFWEWCRKISKGNYVFISEYNAPDDFDCIWSKETLANFDSKRNEVNKDKQYIDKLNR